MDVKRGALWLAPLLALLVGYAMMSTGWSFGAAVVGGVTLLCALWWIFEPIPIPATSLIPMSVFPLTGVLDGKQVALAYGSPIILLLVGGAMMSKAMEKSGAHRRIALMMVHAFGSHSQRRLVMGFMAASAFLSMWISNTATTVMLLPVALAVLESAKGTGADSGRLSVALLLGIAFAASIGGMGTPIGTPPNLVFMSVYREVTGLEKDFLQWMGMGLPVVLLLLPIAGLWLTRGLSSGGHIEIPRPGQVSSAEWRVLAIFSITIVAWMTLKNPFGGWSGWFDLPQANYASVALLTVVILFLCPDGKGDRLLDWPTASSIHWGVMLLFAGGITLAKAFMAVGLSKALGEQLAGLASLPTIFLILCICLAVTFMTEVTSNTATTTLLMPILGAAAIGANLDPALLMVPAAFSASCAFMLPVATAPNALVMASGRLRVAQMAREGVVLNFLGALVISAVVYVVVA
jgi:solute carrier family 13 (sodium-dependent dicarboxylate transporter), member 2/3/5